jgi:hypothetical protein
MSLEAVLASPETRGMRLEEQGTRREEVFE